MQEEHDTIKLAISGTLFTGFEFSVQRNWALNATHESIINTIKQEVIAVTQLHRMWQLEQVARETDLQIHVPINDQTQVIYVCECDNNQP